MKHEPDPSSIEDLKDLLAKSFDSEEGDDVPPLPDSLRDRIADQYGRSSAPAPEKSSESFFARLTSLFAQPAFAGVAAALVIVLTATVLLNQPNGDTSGVRVKGPQLIASTRGGEDTSAVTLVLFRIDEASAQSIRAADLFDEKAVKVATTAAELDAISPPRIVINGGTGTIQAFADGSDSPVEADLPTDPKKLADTVAELLQQIR